MTMRTPVTAAALCLLAFTTNSRAYAQPIAPNRPPANAFGNFFNPGTTVVPNAGMTQYGIPRAGNAGLGPNAGLIGGLGSQSYYGPFAPYILSKQPVVFNNRGHWFSNYYGHWYPNGLTNGTGVLSNGGTAFRIGGTAGGGGLLGANAPGAGLSAGGLGGGAGGAAGAMPGGLAMPAAPVINR
jgi:hypothetical protein